MKSHIILLFGLCLFCGQALAGLFSDDDARLQIQQVGVRVSTLEEDNKKQADINNQQVETNARQAEANKKLFDLQSQLESLSTDLRNLRGLNEELAHKLQDAEKRQKDYYIDLDNRVRHFETPEAQLGANSPVLEVNRAFESAQGAFNAGKQQEAIAAFQEFIKQFPDSVYIPIAHYEIGEAYFALKDYQNALDSYQLLTNKFSFSPKAPDAMLATINCQIALKNIPAAKKVFKQLVAKYPGSTASSEAKKRLAKFK